jgi:hypothetical protein
LCVAITGGSVGGGGVSRGQMGAVMKMKEARAKAIEEGATPESVGATHPWALPVNPADIVVPRAKLCPQMDPRGAPLTCRGSRYPAEGNQIALGGVQGEKASGCRSHGPPSIYSVARGVKLCPPDGP